MVSYKFITLALAAAVAVVESKRLNICKPASKSSSLGVSAATTIGADSSSIHDSTTTVTSVIIQSTETTTSISETISSTSASSSISPSTISPTTDSATLSSSTGVFTSDTLSTSDDASLSTTESSASVFSTPPISDTAETTTSDDLTSTLDASLTLVTTPTPTPTGAKEYVVNGGFETDTIAPWTVDSGSEYLTIEASSKDIPAYEGGKYLHARLPGGNPGGNVCVGLDLVQDIHDLDPAKSYKLSFHTGLGISRYYNDEAGEYVAFWFYIDDRFLTIMNYSNGESSYPLGSWQSDEPTFRPDGSTIRLKIKICNNGYGTNDLLLDRVSIVELTSVTS